MPTDRQLDEVEHIIDAALSSYSATEPPPGLEDRVLARVFPASSEHTFPKRLDPREPPF